ncbi:diacylglycerol/lipid kinase family protein [Desulfobacula phenolica]|uniref:Lipid kinase, YegS/Rv2252/BmrU family n=1 Tax=Desulfobacula phenolica TaxID=90732 RepID=A0A1H2K2N7_9BACT|nr:diacylglycerol kinase family protein [Desulfobacula phenolica]SDU62970.1 lipid kinase, YegS/Rv2252/BmrU family [Desulfobacula phenolica]
MKVALIANPYAGGKKVGKLLPVIEKKLAANRIDYQTHLSCYHGHILKIASALNIKQYDAIAAVGGDGSNFHILNGLLSRFKPEEIPPIAVIPVGTGNSFARDLNIHTFEDGIRSLVKNNPRWVDVCSFTQGTKKKYFVNILGLGFATDVAKTAQKFKFLKNFSYLIGVFYRAARLSCHHMELEIDGKPLSQENCFVEFCNSRFTGGNMLIAPDAEIDDGFMDIIIAEKVSRTTLLTTLPQIYTGTHIRHPAVKHIKAQKATIKTWPGKTLSPDGEIIGVTPTTISVHHKMIRYLR